MPSSTVAGRKVFHVLGTVTQTVNICTETSARGEYEERYSLPITVPVLASDFAGMLDLEALRQWLLAQGGEPLGPASTSGSASRAGGAHVSRLPQPVAASTAGPAWISQAKAALEGVLRQTVSEFLEAPYLHRVEHSLHTQLWAALSAALNSGDVYLKTGERTQTVHKEWPTLRPMPSKDGMPNPRGLFDLALLAPEQIAASTLAQFSDGRIEAPLVLEVGLDYGATHLSDDILKMSNSKVPTPYLLHLSRVPLRDAARDEVERLVMQPGDGFRCAYAHLDPRTGALRWKHHDEVTISTE